MKENTIINHQFVEYIPTALEERVLYISIPFKTAVHKCCCGCGNEVVTPLSPTDWQLTFNGENVSLSPSIGNWSFNCRSHYWIRNNQIVWDRKWSQKEINETRIQDRYAKELQFKSNIKKKLNFWKFFNK